MGGEGGEAGGGGGLRLLCCLGGFVFEWGDVEDSFAFCDGGEGVVVGRSSRVEGGHRGVGFLGVAGGWGW